MAINKIPSFEEYKQWMNHTFKIRNLGAYKLHFERESKLIEESFSNLEFWKTLVGNLPNYYDEYFLVEKQYLFSNRSYKPELLIKSFPSLIEKTYRKNVINNKNWPNPPNVGWVTPENWFSRINDIIRTKIVVNYLEGMNYLTNEIQQVCNKYEVKFAPKFPPSYEARMEGYYAINSYFENLEFNITDQKTGNDKPINISVELQITTQMQDLMRGLLHTEYEKARIKRGSDLDWAWNYKDDKFSTVYLAHILHYAEGMIMQIIDKNRNSEE